MSHSFKYLGCPKVDNLHRCVVLLRADYVLRLKKKVTVSELWNYWIFFVVETLSTKEDTLTVVQRWPAVSFFRLSWRKWYSYDYLQKLPFLQQAGLFRWSGQIICAKRLFWTNLFSPGWVIWIIWIICKKCHFRLSFLQPSRWWK